MEDDRKFIINGLELHPYGDYSFKDLSGCDLSHAELRGANLVGANLRSTNLRHANLRGANFSHADLSDADLRNTDLAGIDRSYAPDQVRRKFEFPLNSTAPGYSFRQRTLFINSKLIGANMESLRLGEVDFSGADLSKAKLSNSRFTTGNGIGLTCGCVLTGANLEASELKNCVFSVPKLHTDKEIGFIGSWMAASNLRHADLTGSSLIGCFLSGAILPDGSLHHNYSPHLF